jgi:F-type H+-transporting ATPase subunit b
VGFNATLIGQMITFGLFVWFTMTFVWPPLTKAMQDRQKRIAEGLAAAERGVREQEMAQTRATETLREAKQHAQEIIRQAEKRAADLIEESKNQARAEGERQLEAARAEIDQELNRAREHLRGQVAEIAVAGASRILQREVDAKAHRKMLDELVSQL